MTSQEVREYLESLDLCSICILRYQNASNEETFKAQNDLENETIKENSIKRTKPNICIACLGIFESIEAVAKNVLKNSTLQSFECDSLYTSVQVPIELLVRELSIWLALIQQFPGKISEGNYQLEL